MTLRIGAVSYLNTKPLICGLREQLGESANLSLNLPSRLADDLRDGRLDIALIPSVEYLRNPDYTIVSDAAIACRGPVWSVRLLSRVKASEIKTLALDEGSRTSAALIQSLLWDMYRLRPTIVPLHMEQSPDSIEADAALVIGDRAMHPESGTYREIWDLGDRWCRLTGLPFVFAMWVARKGVDAGSIATILADSRNRGLECLREIAERDAGSHGLTSEDLFNYFDRNLHFTFGPEERAGLAEFRRRITELQLIANAHSSQTSIQS